MRLPAHARALLDDRLKGKHPPHVKLMFGPRIVRRREGEAMVSVIADEYVPGAFDWTVLAGVIVTIIDWAQSDHAETASLRDESLTNRLLAMLVEVDRVAVGAELRTRRSVPAPPGSRWALDTADPFPLDSVSVSDLDYFLGRSPYTRAQPQQPN
jgi:hypothetical protein